MNYELNTTPAAVYANFATAVDAYRVGGVDAQVMWVEGQKQARRSRQIDIAMQVVAWAGAAVIFAITTFAALA